MTTGIELITEERQRQKVAEGFSRKHDSDHINCELAFVAAHYAAPERIYIKCEPESDPTGLIYFQDCWPKNWDRIYDKKNKHDRIRQLTIAGALIAAEIDRIQNME